jgi:hypothetical protein
VLVCKLRQYQKLETQNPRSGLIPIGMPPNGLTPNGLTPNELNRNGFMANEIPANGPKPEELARIWFKAIHLRRNALFWNELPLKELKRNGFEPKEFSANGLEANEPFKKVFVLNEPGVKIVLEPSEGLTTDRLSMEPFMRLNCLAANGSGLNCRVGWENGMERPTMGWFMAWFMGGCRPIMPGPMRGRPCPRAGFAINGRAATQINHAGWNHLLKLAMVRLLEGESGWGSVDFRVEPPAIRTIYDAEIFLTCAI